MSSIPFRKQRYYYDCGATALEMALLYFGKEVSYKEILKITCPEGRGTPNSRLIKVARNFGLKAKECRKSTWEELMRLFDEEKIIIVNYTEPEDNWGHFAVVVGYDKNSLYLNDPTHGPKFKIEKQEFLRRWHGSRTKHWLAAIYK